MSNEELVKQIQKGINSADNMELLYLQNERYIDKIAKRYSFNGDYEDLMQESYLGLHEATKRYEDTAGIPFMTYASFWIKQSIIRYQENCGRIIKLPSWLSSKVLHYKKAITAYETQLGRKPTDDELCRHLGVNRKVLQSLIKASYHFGKVKSLDEPMPGNDDVDILLGDGVPDPNINVEENTINRLMEKSLQTELWDIVKDNTTSDENAVIIARYIHSMSLEATGQSMGKTRDMARNIEAKAIRKLRLPRISGQIKERFEVNYATVYRTSFTGWKQSWESAPERIAIRNIEAEEKYLNKTKGR
jgi:RNA polymerase primary sigma factor